MFDEIEDLSKKRKSRGRILGFNYYIDCFHFNRRRRSLKILGLLLIGCLFLVSFAYYVNASEDESITLGVVVPYTKKDAKQVFELLSRWDKMSPCLTVGSNRPVLSLYQNKRRDVAFERGFSERIREFDSMKCFQKIKFDYANLTPEQDMYPFGPSFMFWKFMLLREGTSFSKLNPRCVLILEPDTYPVRENFLSRFVEQCRDRMEDTWMLGSLPRRLPQDVSSIQMSENLAYRFHLNGNALYAYRNQEFREFLSHVFEWTINRGMSDSGAYDTDIASYLLAPEHWLETQNMYHKFRASDMIRNYWHSHRDLHPKEIRESSDQVVLVHYSRLRETIDRISKVAPVHVDNQDVQWSKFEPTVRCPSLRVFGHGDGRKTLCGFRDMILKKTRPVIVYSFGSNNEDSFERAIIKECDEVGRACFVSTFDPTSAPPPKSLEIENYDFFSVGLGASDGLDRVCVTVSCKEDGEFLIRPVRTLGSIMYALNHNYVDVLKVDIEGAEFSSFLSVVTADDEEKCSWRNLPLSNVAQLSMEIHWPDAGESMVRSLFERLHQCGFRVFFKEVNELYPRGAEFSFINTNFFSSYTF